MSLNAQLKREVRQKIIDDVRYERGNTVDSNKAIRFINDCVSDIFSDGVTFGTQESFHRQVLEQPMSTRNWYNVALAFIGMFTQTDVKRAMQYLPSLVNGEITSQQVAQRMYAPTGTYYTVADPQEAGERFMRFLRHADFVPLSFWSTFEAAVGNIDSKFGNGSIGYWFPRTEHVTKRYKTENKVIAFETMCRLVHIQGVDDLRPLMRLVKFSTTIKNAVLNKILDDPVMIIDKPVLDPEVYIDEFETAIMSGGTDSFTKFLDAQSIRLSLSQHADARARIANALSTVCLSHDVMTFAAAKDDDARRKSDALLRSGIFNQLIFVDENNNALMCSCPATRRVSFDYDISQCFQHVKIPYEYCDITWYHTAQNYYRDLIENALGITIKHDFSVIDDARAWIKKRSVGRLRVLALWIIDDNPKTLANMSLGADILKASRDNGDFLRCDSNMIDTLNAEFDKIGVPLLAI